MLFSLPFASITELMFIHIASDFLSTHIKCFLLSIFNHNFWSAEETGTDRGKKNKCSMNEKTNKLINIQSFGGREALFKFEAAPHPEPPSQLPLCTLQNYSIMWNLDAVCAS
jgi:hypothetical protein